MTTKRSLHGGKRSRIRGSRKNILNKAVDASIVTMKSTSKKYMPKVKSSLENVGSKVVSSTQKSVPFFKRMTQKLFSVFGSRSRKHRRH